MSTAIAKVQPATVSANSSFTDVQVALIKRTICQGASDDELALFMTTAQRLGLDPFARQIFAVKRWDSRSRTEVMAIQVSIDGFRLVAERTGNYAPGKPTDFETDGMGKVVKATAFVKKFRHGEWHEAGEDAFYEEYVQTNKEGKPNAMWARMPRVMLAKCAEARALRRAFPMELGGVYIPEEMDQAENGRPAGAQFKAPPQQLDAPVDVEPAESVDELIELFMMAPTTKDLNAVAARARGKTGAERDRLKTAYKSRLTELTAEPEGFVEEEAAS